MQQQEAVKRGDLLMNIASSVHASSDNAETKKVAKELFETARLVVSSAIGTSISYSIDDNSKAQSRIGGLPRGTFQSHKKEIISFLKILVVTPRIYTDDGKVIVISPSRLKRIRTLINKF